MIQTPKIISENILSNLTKNENSLATKRLSCTVKPFITDKGSMPIENITFAAGSTGLLNVKE